MRYDNTRSARAEEGLLRLLTLDDALFGAEPPLREDEFSSPLLGRLFSALWQQRQSGAVRLGALDAQFSAEELGHLASVLQEPVSTDHAAREKALRDYIRIIREEAGRRGTESADPLAAAMRKFAKNTAESEKDGGSRDGKRDG